MILAKFLILAVASINMSAFAHANSDLYTKILSGKACERFLTNTANDDHSLTAPFPPYRQGFIQGRGLLTTDVPVNPENMLKGKSLGINEWGIRIYPVSSEAEALQHYNSGGGNKNPLEAYTEMPMQTWYLLLPNGQKWDSFNDEQRAAYNKLPEAEKSDYGTWQYKKAIKQGAKLMFFERNQVSRSRIEKRLVELQEILNQNEKLKDTLPEFIETYEQFLLKTEKRDTYHYRSLPIDIVNTLPALPPEDKWTEVPTDTAKKIVKLEVSYSNETDGEFLYQYGWFTPEARGVIKIDDFLARSTAKDLGKFIKSLLNKGYRITFNQALRMVMQESGDQVRGTKAIKGASRFTETQIESYEQLQKQGNAFSVEIWHPEGFLAAGTFGTISNGVVGAESVYYPKVNDPDLIALKELFQKNPLFAAYASDPVLKKSIDFAKTTVLLLMNVLKANGIEFIDAGMVTPFTRKVSGKYIWREEYRKLVQDTVKKSAGKQVQFPPAMGSVPKEGTVPMKIKDFVEKHSPKQK